MSRSAPRKSAPPIQPYHLILLSLAALLAAWLVRANATAPYPRHQKIEVPIISFFPPTQRHGDETGGWAAGEATVEFVNDGRVDRRKVPIAQGDLVAGKPAESLTGLRDVPKGTMIELYQSLDDPWQLSTKVDDLGLGSDSDNVTAGAGWAMVISAFLAGGFLLSWLRALIWGTP